MRPLPPHVRRRRASRRTPISQRKAIIEAMRQTTIEHAQSLAQLAVDETRMGRVADKVKKNLLVAEKTPASSACRMRPSTAITA